MSYISPIKLNTIPEMEEGWTDKVAKYIAGEVDNLILESCMKVVCDVNKDELIKALQYDRGQYEKGYADGKRDAQPHWVSVEDELPKNVANRVLAFCENGVMYAAHYEGGETDKWYMNMGTWWEEGTGKLTVTHWMPLPEPPQEVQDGTE